MKARLEGFPALSLALARVGPSSGRAEHEDDMKNIGVNLDGIFGLAVGLLEEVDSAQDPALSKRERAKAARNILSFVEQFNRAGLAVGFHDADHQPVAPGNGTVAFLMVHAKSRPTLAAAVELVKKGGRLEKDPLQDACLVWSIKEPTMPEDALSNLAESMMKAPPRKPKARPALAVNTRH